MHGIVGNNWYDRAAEESVYCASDTSVRGVSNDGLDGDGSVLGGSGKMSPARLLSTTLGDELKVATGRVAKVFGMSMKDRGAILPAGHAADGAFGFGQDRGQFISSNHYGDALLLAARIQRQRSCPSVDGRGLSKLHPDGVYAQCLPDNNPYEGAFKGELKPTFPDLNALAEENGGFDVLKGTPGGNTLIVDVAGGRQGRVGARRRDRLAGAQLRRHRLRWAPRGAARPRNHGHVLASGHGAEAAV